MKNIIFLLLFPFTSCSLIFGIKDINKVSSIDYQNELKILNNSKKHVEIYSDSNSFSKYVNMDLYQKELYQPIQILYFHNDSLISHHLNCYAKGGIGKLDWNTEFRFSTFPPKSAAMLRKNITISSLKAIYPDIKNNKYTIIFFWSSMLFRQTKDAKMIIERNLIENNVDLINVNINLININEFYKE
ncbi:MAG: hypothetical protein KA313_06375 [Pseudarcicella sp.]|nr:hypothetical protein [Pseudarcicella sp.]MBP6410707.1 hypothetical protein [Pseudarcicella sp.]